MILVKLRGGLSNQLFQYAAARSLAERHRTQVLIDTSWYGNLPPGATPRAYMLDHFRISGTLASADDLVGTDGVRNATFRDLPLALWRRFRPRFRFVAEAGLPFDPAVHSLPDNVCLFGYWLSEKYFADIEPVIRREFALRLPPAGENARLISILQEVMSASVHVRRGDYVDNPEIARIHGTCSLEYYASAAAHLVRAFPEVQFFVFSDDVRWAQDHLFFDRPTHFVSLNTATSAHEDLRLMSQCRHHVIANSGFSWWGAWLNPRHDKIVCAPRRWFTDKSYDANDVVPDGWVRF
jgi:hypothetical protein